MACVNSQTLYKNLQIFNIKLSFVKILKILQKYFNFFFKEKIFNKIKTSKKYLSNLLLSCHSLSKEVRIGNTGKKSQNNNFILN